jgi:hypothetical protein
MTTNITELFGLKKDEASGLWKSQTFTSSGIFYVPEGVQVVKIVMAGGGGGGGYWDMPGGMGGDSIFGSPISVTAKGGWGAGRIDVNASTENLISGWGGSGGGVSGGEVMSLHPSGIISLIGTQLILKLNAGMVYRQSSWSNLIKTHGGLGISSGNSVSGGGGASGSRRGGAVIGFGKSGFSGMWTPTDFDSNEYGPGGGGGASFGDGGRGCGRPAVNATPIAAQNGTHGSGGGGGAYVLTWRSSMNFIGGGGGGGGEIVVRDVPVNGAAAIPVTIGSGGAGAAAPSGNYGSKNSFPGGQGGNGICQIFWS